MNKLKTDEGWRRAELLKIFAVAAATLLLSACAEGVFNYTGGLIKQILVEKTSVCVGEVFRVSVTAEHPSNIGEHVQVYVDGWPGNPQFMQFYRAEEKRLIHVTAHTADQLKDAKTVEVEVKKCGDPPRYLRVFHKRNPYHRYRVDFRAALYPEPTSPLVGAVETYDWTFGDGKTATTNVPFVSHDYSKAIQHPARYTEFQISVVHRHSNFEARRTIAIPSSFYTSLRMGFVQAEIEHTKQPLPGGDASVAIQVHNYHTEPIIFDRYLKQYHHCDPGIPPRWQEVSAYSIFGSSVLPQVAQDGYPKKYEPNTPNPTSPGVVKVDVEGTQHGRMKIPASQIPRDICVIGYSLLGRTPSDLKVYGNFWIEVRRNPVKIETESNIRKLQLLKHLIDQNLVNNPDLITTEDLYYLEQQGVIKNTSNGWGVVQP